MTIALTYILKYWKYVVIGILLIVCYYYYSSNKSLNESLIIVNHALAQQNKTISAYRSQYNDTLQALAEKENTIAQLEQQISSMDLSLDQIIEQDIEAKTWAEELYNPTIINKVINTPIILE
jgi:septal ring factor EnvC (AmiA/AmiB activator)